MAKLKVSASANENWVKEENVSHWKKKAIQLASERKKHEKDLLKQGKKQKLIPHPTSPRCQIMIFE